MLEDESDVRETIVGILELEHINVISFGSAPEALFHIEKHLDEISLIVSDIKMPMMDGLEFISRASQFHKGLIPTILLTSFSDTEYLRDGLRLGVLDYIQKPFEMKDFLTRIYRGIEVSKKLRAMRDDANGHEIVEKHISAVNALRVSNRNMGSGDGSR